MEQRKKRVKKIQAEYDEKKQKLEEFMAESDLPEERKKQLLADSYENFFQELCQNEARTQFNKLKVMSNDPEVDCKTKRQIAVYIIDRAHGKPKDRQIIESEPIRVYQDIKPQPQIAAPRTRDERDDTDNTTVGEV